MPNELEVCIPATATGLITALTTIDQFRAVRNLDLDSAGRLRLVAEELISNTIKYGYGGDCERPIRLWLRPEPRLTLIYEDEASPFDPTAWRPDEAMAASLEHHEGQAGIALILGLSASVQYRRLAAGNQLTIMFGPKNARV